MKKALMVAHRGLSSKYYQNTLQAFREAVGAGVFDCIETDIRLTQDGVWICAHDPDPFRDSSLYVDCIPYEVASTSPLNENKSRGVKVEEDVFLCTFEEYLDVCKDGGLKAIIEVKINLTEQQTKELLDLIYTKLSREQFVIISFSKDNIDKVRDKDAYVNTQVLTSRYFVAHRLLSQGYNIGINNRIASRGLINKAKARGQEINIWTVNSATRADYLIRAGVSYLTTDCILEV